MADERQQYGGQAVVEGVMMRSPRFFAVACRRLSSGEIVIQREHVETVLKPIMWLNKPFLRGSLALIDAMAMGMKALTYAANVQAQDSPNAEADETKPAVALDLALGEGGPISPLAPNSGGTGSKTINGIAIGLTTVLALVIGFSLFWTLPWFLTAHFFPGHGRFAANLIEGGIRLAIFFGYIGLISQMAHVKRVFQYHGAEHKAINTLEAGQPLTVESARESSRIHPRCGTNFIFIVLITSVFVFSILPRQIGHSGAGSVLEMAGLRLLLLPVVAGIAYEILKWAGANRDKGWAQGLIAPGLWTQYLTTRIPDDSQIEVALAALQSVWDKEHEMSPTPPPSLPSADEPAAAVA